MVGSLTATGGIGAALASTSHNNASFNYLYDGNGNVIATCDSLGAIVTRIAYSPFGEIIGEKPEIPFAFSTKSTDASALVYFGFRFYNSDLGRWLSRDPIEENGGNNLYAMVHNDPIANVDLFGNETATGSVSWENQTTAESSDTTMTVSTTSTYVVTVPYTASCDNGKATITTGNITGGLQGDLFPNGIGFNWGWVSVAQSATHTTTQTSTAACCSTGGAIQTVTVNFTVTSQVTYGIQTNFTSSWLRWLNNLSPGYTDVQHVASDSIVITKSCCN